MIMFDANARHLKKGTLFFAKRNNNLLYCKMLDGDHKNPRVKIITCYSGASGYYGHIFQEKESDWVFMPYQGYVENGELRDFVDDKVKDMAHSILSRIDSHDTCDGTKIIKPYSSGWVKND